MKESDKKPIKNEKIKKSNNKYEEKIKVKTNFDDTLKALLNSKPANKNSSKK